MRVYWPHEAYREILRCRYRHQHMWGVDVFDRHALLWADAASLAPGWDGRMAKLRTAIEDRLRNRRRFSTYTLEEASLRDYLARIARFRPAMLYGYSSALHLLARTAVEQGWQFDFLKLIVLSGEPALSFRDGIESAFDAPAVDEYGAIEVGVIAYEDRDRRLRVRGDIMLLETLPAGDGVYDIVVTNLANPAFPLIRYAIKDQTDAPVQAEADGFASLGRIMGRSNDFIIAKSGRLFHPEFVSDLLFQFYPEARRFRVHQGEDGAVTVRLEVPSGQRVDFARLERILRTMLDGYPVDFESVERLPSSSSGKHRFITSALAPLTVAGS